MISRDSLETKLTPAAKQVLHELITEYREHLLFNAAESAERLGELREISVHDIIAGTSNNYKQMFNTRQTIYDRIIKIYYVLGQALSMSALSIFIYLRLVQGYEGIPPTLLAMICVGLAMSLITYILRLKRKARSASVLLNRSNTVSEENKDEMFVTLWRDLEVALQRKAAIYLGESVASNSISTVINELTESELLSEKDRVLLIQILKMRNLIAHGSANLGSMDREAINELARSGRRLLERILNTILNM